MNYEHHFGGDVRDRKRPTSGDIRETLFGPPDDLSDWTDDEIQDLLDRYDALRAEHDALKAILEAKS